MASSCDLQLGRQRLAGVELGFFEQRLALGGQRRLTRASEMPHRAARPSSSAASRALPCAASFGIARHQVAVAPDRVLLARARSAARLALARFLLGAFVGRQGAAARSCRTEPSAVQHPLLAGHAFGDRAVGGQRAAVGVDAGEDARRAGSAGGVSCADAAGSPASSARRAARAAIRAPDCQTSFRLHSVRGRPRPRRGACASAGSRRVADTAASRRGSQSDTGRPLIACEVLTAESIDSRRLRCRRAPSGPARSAPPPAGRRRARIRSTDSRFEVPAEITSSTITTRPASGAPTSVPPSPWSLASLRL